MPKTKSPKEQNGLHHSETFGKRLRGVGNLSKRKGLFLRYLKEHCNIMYIYIYAMYQKKRPQYIGAHWIVWSLWDFRSVRTVPPNLHLKKLNPNIDLSNFACCIPDSWHVFDVMDDTVISSLLWTSFHPAAIPGSILPSKIKPRPFHPPERSIRTSLNLPNHDTCTYTDNLMFFGKKAVFSCCT